MEKLHLKVIWQGTFKLLVSNFYLPSIRNLPLEGRIDNDPRGREIAQWCEQFRMLLVANDPLFNTFLIHGQAGRLSSPNVKLYSDKLIQYSSEGMAPG